MTRKLTFYTKLKTGTGIHATSPLLQRIEDKFVVEDAQTTWSGVEEWSGKWGLAAHLITETRGQAEGSRVLD